MIEERIERARRRELAWDELRRERVLRGILGVLRPGRAGRPRRTHVIAAFGAAIAAAIVAVLALRPATEPAPLAAVGEIGEAPLLRLRDGSQAALAAGAEVLVQEETAARVRLRQLRGRVRYEVVPGLPRTFVIEAASTTLEVVGTVFTVELEDDVLRIAVEEGAVRIRQRTSEVVTLGAGESLVIRPEATASASVVPDPSVAPTASADTSASEGKPTKRSRALRRPAADELMATADAQRDRGDLDGAVRSLHRLVAEHPRDRRVSVALFTLGQIESARGHHAAAGEAFDACWSRDRGGALAEDALAEAALSFRRAGRNQAAGSAAGRYLELHPTGLHAERMRRIVDLR